MKRLIITILVCAVLSVDQAQSRPYSVSRFGDVTVENNGETFKCDQITCPAGTASCQVTKSKEDQKADFIVRRNICFASNGDILLEKTTQDAVAPGHSESLKIVVGANGSISQSHSSSGSSSSINGANFNFDQEAFNKNLQAEIDRNIKATLNQVQQNLQHNFGYWGGGNPYGNPYANAGGAYNPWG